MKRKYWVVLLAIGIIWFLYWDPSYWNSNGYNLSSDPGRPGELSLTNPNNIVLAEFVSKIGGNKDYIIVESKNEKKTEYWIIKQKTKNNQKEGPLNFNEFKNRKTELFISELKFEKNFKK
jgi:hypothetical protein|tara:strand:+ start:431 stop:790 length:360 start_codon:yes stop_codon:yes gene_type:complete